MFIHGKKAFHWNMRIPRGSSSLSRGSRGDVNDSRDPLEHKRSSRMRNMCICKHNNGQIKKRGRLLGHVCTTWKVNAPWSEGWKKQINIGFFEGYLHKGRISRARSTSAVGRLCGTVWAQVLLHTRAVESEKWSWKRKEYEKPRVEMQHSAGRKKWPILYGKAEVEGTVGVG